MGRKGKLFKLTVATSLVAAMTLAALPTRALADVADEGAEDAIVELGGIEAIEETAEVFDELSVEEAAEESDGLDSEEAAEEATETPDEALTAQGVLTGKSGTCEWSFSDGKLVVRPANGASEGTLGEWQTYDGAPWPAWNVTSARFEGTVHAKTCLGMFYGADGLTSVDLSGLDTSSVTDMDWMFGFCKSLKSLDLSNLNTASVKRMHGTFCGCESLESINLTGWDTSSVTHMDWMFTGLAAKSLDLSGFNTSSVENMSNMFDGCPNLSTIYVSGRWSTSSLKASENMFHNCMSLVGGNGTAFDPAHIDGSRARVDSKDAPGYLTFKAYSSFPDVPKSHWAHEVVSRAVALGLASGYSNGKFGTNDPVTRGQVAVILWNMAGKPAATSGAKSFSDVVKGKYYYDAVKWASSTKVVSGYAGGKFGPDDKVTREQLAAMLANYARNVGGADVAGSKADYSSMSDASAVSSWASQSVGWCFANKIISGANGKVLPRGEATRAQTAKMVVFLHDLLQ